MTMLPIEGSSIRSPSSQEGSTLSLSDVLQGKQLARTESDSLNGSFMADSRCAPKCGMRSSPRSGMQQQHCCQSTAKHKRMNLNSNIKPKRPKRGRGRGRGLAAGVGNQRRLPSNSSGWHLENSAPVRLSPCQQKQQHQIKKLRASSAFRTATTCVLYSPI